MTTMNGFPLRFTTILISITVLFAAVAAAQNPAPKEKVEAIKTSFQQSQKILRKYEWIEIQIVSYKGEEKSRTQNRCYYGSDGKLTKVEVSSTKADTPGGFRGHIAKKKKGEMTEYMQQAVDTIKLYVPPDPAMIQRAFESGNSAIHPNQPGNATEISFSNYLMPKDNLSFLIDAANNRIQGVKIQTYIADPEDAVSLNVSYSTFPDGTIYAEQTTLDAPAKHVSVTIQNSGYRIVGR